MNLLFLELKTVCYNSYIYFAESLSKQFIDNGHTVEFFRVPEEPLDNIEKYINQKFDAIIDFNSEIPRAILDDDSYFLDSVNAPFIDIILDHPLYHNDTLKHKISNFYVVCLDYNHKEYIKTYYPHIKDIIVYPMTGSLAFGENEIDWNNWEYRPYDITFSGSYTSPNRILKTIATLPHDLQNCINNVIEIIRNNQSITIESAIKELASTDEYDYINLAPAVHHQILYLADAYIRCLNRHNLIKELDTTGKCYHLFGPLWEEMILKNAIIHREIPFNLTFTVFYKSKICINILPNFKAGAHDRIFSAQLNGAVSLTDSSSMIDSEYINQKNILLFNLNNMASINKSIELDNQTLKKIAQEGFKIASKNHTWTNIYQAIKNLIDRIN